MKNLYFSFFVLFSIVWSPFSYGMEDLELYLELYRKVSGFNRKKLEKSYGENQIRLGELRELRIEVLEGRRGEVSQRELLLKQYTEEENDLDKKERSLEFRVEKLLRALEGVLNYSEDEKFLRRETSNYDFCQIYNQICLGKDSILFLKSVLPTIFSESQWSTIFKTLESLEEDTPSFLHPLDHEHYEYWISKEFYSSLEQACEQLSYLTQRDTLIGPGNTPQFVLQALKVISPNPPNILEIPLSGHPGKMKPYDLNFVKGILTPKALENYLLYLQEVLGDLKDHKSFTFVDIIGEAGGILFLRDCILSLYKKNSLPAPPFHIIAINSLEEKNPLESFFSSVRSLGMNEFAKKLDRVDDCLRVTPNFPAINWNPWKEPRIAMGEHTASIIRNINERFLRK